MSWRIAGSYFETCSCDVVCPCTASLSLGATNDYCRVVLVFHVKEGDVVLYSKYGGTEVKYNGEEYLVLSARDLLAVVNK